MLKETHGAKPVKEVGRAAGEVWNRMGAEQRAPYAAQSRASQQEYRDKKQLQHRDLEELNLPGASVQVRPSRFSPCLALTSHRTV